MRRSDIEGLLAHIRVKAGDPGLASALEGALYERFVRAVARGLYDGDIADGAALVITSKEISFPRWSA